MVEPTSHTARALLAAVGRKMEVDFTEVTKLVPHMLERGGAREDIVRRFLRDHLPDRVGVDSGFIIDRDGLASRQLDVLLFDKQSTPRLPISETVNLFPAETVMQTVEVKSFLDKGALETALANIQSVAELKAEPAPPDPLLGGFAIRPLFQGDGLGIKMDLLYRRLPIQSGIFAFDSVELRTLFELLSEELPHLPRTHWPSFVVSMSKGVIAWGSEGVGGTSRLAVGPHDQTRMLIFEAGNDHPLLVFYALVLQNSQVALSARPMLTDYLALSEHKWAPTPGTDTGD
jgi:hypothetical protein